MKKTILVTGSTGFIGRNLTRNLQDRYQILAPTHTELELINTKAVESYFSAHSIDCIVHTAVVGGSREEEHVDHDLSTNLRIFFNIVRCSRYFKKMIHFGTGAEYDKTRSLKRVKETSFGESVPPDNYGLFKYIAGSYVEHTSSPIVNLRLFSIFGHYEDYRYRFISNIIAKIVWNRPLTMYQDAYFDYMYIDDLMPIVDYFITHRCTYRSYNIGTGVRRKLSDIASLIKQVAHCESEISVAKKGMNFEYTPDITRLRSEIPSLRFSDFDDQVKKLYSWYTKHKKLIDPNSL